MISSVAEVQASRLARFPGAPLRISKSEAAPAPVQETTHALTSQVGS